MQRLAYVPALDGLRAVSIALVVSYHAFGLPIGGTIGVDVFFVLSGYLITGLLLSEFQATGRIDFRSFYSRRCRRLLPALLFMLLVYLPVAAAFGKNEVFAAVVGVAYVANFFDAAGSLLLSKASLNQLWSLAQEEQFYLLWPAALVVLSRWRRLTGIIIAAAIAVVVSRAALSLAGGSTNVIFYEPYLRADGLLIGAAIAAARLRRPFAVGDWAGKIGASGLCVGAIIGWGFVSWPVWGEPLFLGTVALLLLAALSDTEAARILSTRPLVWLGRRSYSLYLWHAPVIAACIYLAGDTFSAKVGAILIATAIAGFSYRFVEQPLRKPRQAPDSTAAAQPAEG